MEFNDGKITPTTKQEARVFSRLLIEQEVACQRSPQSATVTEVGVELVQMDSYKLFCAMERAYNNPEIRSKKTNKEEVKIMGRTVAALAMAYLDSLDIDGFQDEAESFFATPDDEHHWVFGFAAHSLKKRYAD